jgi:PKD repeat protein
VGTGTTVFFNASNVQWAGRTITGYSWNFGDGRTGSGVTTTHQYSGVGTYTVVLTVTDSAGAQQRVQTTVSVTATGGAVANLTASTTSPRVNQRVVFDATTSTPSTGASIVNYRFIWGDGGEETSNVGLQSHTYTSTGTFTVTVVVTDSNGKTASRSVTVTVAP